MILSLLLACAPRAVDTAPDGPSVVMIVVDTLRADLGGADWPEWLDDGLVYTNAYSASSWTSSSSATLVSGRYPLAGERRHPSGGEQPCEGPHPGLDLPIWPPPAHRWPDRVLTDQPNIAMLAGLPLPEWEGPGSEALVAEAIAALDDGHQAIYIHTVGAHGPYDGRLLSNNSSVTDDFLRSVRCGAMDRDQEGWARLQYRSAVEHSLAYLEPLVRAAQASGAVVILTSDHGEALGEDGLWWHASSLHDAQTRVPLVVWGPDVVPGVEERPVPATCLGQTAMKILGDETPGLCDLRDGSLTGDVVTGMLLPDGTWDERVILPTATP